DIVYSLSKAIVFVIVTTTIQCYYGYYASGGPQGVGVAAGRAMRASITVMITVNLLMTMALWGFDAGSRMRGGGDVDTVRIRRPESDHHRLVRPWPDRARADHHDRGDDDRPLRRHVHPDRRGDRGSGRRRRRTAHQIRCQISRGAGRQCPRGGARHRRRA